MKRLFPLLFLLTACSNLTVAPKPVTAHVVAMCDNYPDAGVIDCDQSGCLVRDCWLRHYKELEARYESKAPFLPDSTQIKPEKDNYRISYEVGNHAIELRQRQRNEAGP